MTTLKELIKQKIYESLQEMKKVSIGAIPRISDDIKDALEVAGFDGARKKMSDKWVFTGGDVDSLQQYLYPLGFKRGKNDLMTPKNNEVAEEHQVREIKFVGDQAIVTIITR